MTAGQVVVTYLTYVFLFSGLGVCLRAENGDRVSLPVWVQIPVVILACLQLTTYIVYILTYLLRP